MHTLVAVLITLAASQAAAQPPWRSDAAMQSRSVAERNHLGLLEFCRREGLIDERAVTLQRQMVANLPAVPGNDVEAEGRQGLIVFDGRQTTFAQSAQAQGVTLRFSCEQTALRVLRQEGGS